MRSKVFNSIDTIDANTFDISTRITNIPNISALDNRVSNRIISNISIFETSSTH